MKIVVLRSVKTGERSVHDERYLQETDTHFAERVLGNLRSAPAFCTVCGPDCNNCRSPYGRKLEDDIAAVIDFPAVLPHVLEQPATHLPQEVPRNDVLLIIAIHGQILLEALKACRAWGTRGVVVPLEAGEWIKNAVRSEAYSIAEREGIEIAFPKPFCTFSPPAGTVLAEFRDRFHIGCPDVDLEVDDGKIVKAHVNTSAACGATYCVARWIVDRRLDENLEIEVVSKHWHAYPCTASMERDPDLNDDTPLHMAGQAHYAILKQVKEKVAGLEDPMVRSPLGTTVQKPIPPRENLENIEKAKRLILAELEKRQSVPLSGLRSPHGPSPAAISSALIILKREGRIRMNGMEIRAATES